MVGNEYAVGRDVVTGYLTMNVPALRQTPTGYEIPKFIIKKDGDDPVCSAEWTAEGPEALVSIVDGEEVPWVQDTDINFDVAKEKELYLISQDEFKNKSFFKVKARGDVARKIHTSLKKGDKVVIFGKIASIGRTNFIHADVIYKVEM